MIDTTIWKRAWALLDSRERYQAWLVLGVIILAALASAVMVGSIMPFLAVLSDPSRIETISALAWAYDTFGFTSTYSFLIGLGLASFALIVLSSLIQIAKAYAVARFSMMRMHSISHRLLHCYLSQPYAFFLNRHSGEMGARILTEAGEVVNRFLRPAAEFVAASLTTLAIIAMLLWVEPVVALTAILALGGIYGAIFIAARRRLRHYGRRRVEANRQRFRMANEALTGIKDIKLLGREGAYLARYAQPSTQMAQVQVKINVFAQIPQYALQAVAMGGVLLLCVILIDPDGIESGTALGGILPILGVFAFAGQRLMPELSKLYQALAEMQASTAAVVSVHADLAGFTPRSKTGLSVPARLGLKHALELDRICFSYADTDRVGVQDISLKIRAGQKVGIVGSTGAGKTTLADVILGLLEPSEGRLIADGSAVTATSLRAWTQSVGYVPQDIFLVDASVSENIALGIAPEAIDHDRVRIAAQIARIDTFIRENLPRGYATTIGERGVRLSGGQRQRIGIARAMYQDADLIVFDEATSALDNLTEQEVMEAIDALPGEKTVLMIAHRLSTVKNCDFVIVLDEGRIVGCDSYARLMTDNPAFQRIARLNDAA